MRSTMHAAMAVGGNAALNRIWFFHIIPNVLGCGGFLLLFLCIAGWLRHWRQIGHRLLLVMSAAYCLVRVITHAGAAWDEYVGGTVLAGWVHVIAALAIVGLSLLVLVSREDALVTFRTSEAEDRLRKDMLADQAQAKIQIDYLALQTLEKSQNLVRELSARDRQGCDG